MSDFFNNYIRHYVIIMMSKDKATTNNKQQINNNQERRGNNMNKYEAEQIFTESKEEAREILHISITKTTRAIKMILSDRHDITFFIYKDSIAKIEEYNGREIIEKYIK